MIKTPLRYPGGKSRAVKTISKLVPEFNEYREPFLGGGSLFLHLRQTTRGKKFWVNDLYHNLYCFWKECKENNASLVMEIQSFKDGYKEGKLLHRFLIENIAKMNEMQKAAAFFVFNRITFSGTSESGGYSEAAFKSRFTESSIQRVANTAALLKDVSITNEDYEVLLKTPGENVFIFLDPPYFSATKSALYGKNGKLHKIFDHLRFSEALKNTNHNWLITYDDSPFIRKLFSFAEIMEWDISYGMRNVNADNINQKGKELFISNYPINNSSSQFDLFSDYETQVSLVA